MKFKKIGLIIYLLLSCFFICSTQSLNNSSKLKALIVISDSPTYINEWINKQPEEAIFVEKPSEVRIGETIYISIVIENFSTDKSNKFDIASDILILNPDGSILFDEKNYASEYGYISKMPVCIMLDPALDLTFEIGDQIGTYVIKATIVDKISNEIISTETSIKVIAGEINEKHEKSWPNLGFRN